MNLKITNQKLFNKAKEQALRYLKKNYPNADDYDKKKIDKVLNLNDFPVNNEQLHRLPATVKGIILKAHLKTIYPNCEFSVKKPHYGSLNVEWLNGSYPFGLDEFRNIYVNAGNTDSQSDYYDYDLHILFINSKSGDQHFYKNMDEAKEQLKQFEIRKQTEQKDYYDKAIAYLKELTNSETITN